MMMPTFKDVFDFSHVNTAIVLKFCTKVINLDF